MEHLDHLHPIYYEVMEIGSYTYAAFTTSKAMLLNNVGSGSMGRTATKSWGLKMLRRIASGRSQPTITTHDASFRIRRGNPTSARLRETFEPSLTAARRSLSDPKHRSVMRTIGSNQTQKKDSSSTCGCTDRWNRTMTSRGRCRTSKS